MKITCVKPWLLFFLGVLAAGNCFAQPDYWIDVRSAQEYEQSHLPGALNIPHESIREQIESVTKDKNSEIYLYCGSGHRAGVALGYLQSMGYTQAKNIGGLADAVKLEADSNP